MTPVRLYQLQPIAEMSLWGQMWSVLPCSLVILPSRRCSVSSQREICCTYVFWKVRKVRGSMLYTQSRVIITVEWVVFFSSCMCQFGSHKIWTAISAPSGWHLLMNQPQLKVSFSQIWPLIHSGVDSLSMNYTLDGDRVVTDISLLTKLKPPHQYWENMIGVFWMEWEECTSL